MLCALPDALAMLDTYWQGLTNFEQEFWIQETLYGLGETSLGLLCDALELNPARASMQILTQVSADPALAVLLFPSSCLWGAHELGDSPMEAGFLWLHLKLALTTEQAEHLFHEECLRRWQGTAGQFRKWYDEWHDSADYHENYSSDKQLPDYLRFLVILRMIVEAPLDDMSHLMSPPSRIIDAHKAAVTAAILGHGGTERRHADARQAYHTLLETRE